MGILILSGELLSTYINDFKAALMVALDNSDKLVINFKKVSKLDGAYIQVLCTAVDISKKLKKHIIFNSEFMRQIIRNKCVNCSFGCSFFKSADCLLSPV